MKDKKIIATVNLTKNGLKINWTNNKNKKSK